MARRVYLHVGTTKSGTTYLQRLLNANLLLLDDQGILCHHGVQHRDSVWDFFGSPRLDSRRRGTWAKVSQRIREHSGDALFRELLAPLREKAIGRFRAGFGDAEIRVIITARDLTRVIPSKWQETVQNGSTLSWPDWVKQVCLGPGTKESHERFWRGQYLPYLIGAWSSIAAPEHVYVVTVPQQTTRPEILWQRFAAAVENAPAEVEQRTRTNPSLGAFSAELLRRVNLQVAELKFRDYAPGFKNVLAKKVLVNGSSSEPRLGLWKRDHERIRSIAETMVSGVEVSGARVLGDLNDLVPGEWSGDGVIDPRDIEDAQLLDMAVMGLAGLGVRMSRCVNEHRPSARPGARSP